MLKYFTTFIFTLVASSCSANEEWKSECNSWRDALIGNAVSGQMDIIYATEIAILGGGKEEHTILNFSSGSIKLPKISPVDITVSPSYESVGYESSKVIIGIEYYEDVVYRNIYRDFLNVVNESSSYKNVDGELRTNKVFGGELVLHHQLVLNSYDYTINSLDCVDQFESEKIASYLLAKLGSGNEFNSIYKLESPLEGFLRVGLDKKSAELIVIDSPYLLKVRLYFTSPESAADWISLKNN